MRPLSLLHMYLQTLRAGRVIIWVGVILLVPVILIGLVGYIDSAGLPTLEEVERELGQELPLGTLQVAVEQWIRQKHFLLHRIEGPFSRSIDNIGHQSIVEYCGLNDREIGVIVRGMVPRVRTGLLFSKGTMQIYCFFDHDRKLIHVRPITFPDSF